MYLANSSGMTRHPIRFSLISLQWAAYGLANLLPVPFIVASALGLSPVQAASLAARIFLLTGLGSLLQALIGHRLPIVEGPAGMWWGVFVSLGLLAPAIGMSHADLRASLELGMLAAGLAVGLFGLWRRAVAVLIRVFTPAVTGAIMVLLAVQLAPSIASALIGSPPFLPGLAVGLLTFLAVLGLNMYGRGIWRSASLLVGIAAGTGLWFALGLPLRVGWTGPVLGVPTILAWGMPRLHWSVIWPALLTGLLLLTNLVASLRGMEAVTGAHCSTDTVRRGILMNGLALAAAGLFAVPGTVPYASNAGFVSLSRNAERAPFLAFAALFAVLGFVPAIGGLMVALPHAVVYAALLALFGQMLNIGVKDILREGLASSRALAVMGPILLGIGVMGVPESTWRSLHSPIAFLLGNGMIVGLAGVLMLLPLTRLRRDEADLAG